jgi:hypothetical protein
MNHYGAVSGMIAGIDFTLGYTSRSECHFTPMPRAADTPHLTIDHGNGEHTNVGLTIHFVLG